MNRPIKTQLTFWSSCLFSLDLMFWFHISSVKRTLRYWSFPSETVVFSFLEDRAKTFTVRLHTVFQLNPITNSFAPQQKQRINVPSGPSTVPPSTCRHYTPNYYNKMQLLLCKFFLLDYRTWQLPSKMWKISMIIIISISVKDKTNILSYKPIRLLPCI